MLVPSFLRAAARLTAVVALVGLCADGTAARPAPPELPITPTPVDLPIDIPPGQLRLAALEPAESAGQQPLPPPTPRGPFGLAVARSGEFGDRWQALQPVIRAERTILANCRAKSAPCPAAAAKFEQIIDTARARSGRARVGEINRAVNLAIRPMSDLAQWGIPDVWSPPLTTFGTGAGDCEDYAIAKYVALSEAGVAAADLRLVVVLDRIAGQGHMVAAARVDGHWLILDNRTMRLIADSDVPNLTPLVALGSEEAAPAVAAAPKALPAERPPQTWDTAGLPVVL